MSENSVEHQLLRLHVLLGDDEPQLDELCQTFQLADPGRRGSLKSVAELSSVLRGVLSPAEFKRIDVDKIAARFSSSNGQFDYTTFCKALQRPPLLQSESRGNGSRSPTKRRIRSPTKQQQREARMRIDKRLESQRLIMESVRHKLLRGVKGNESEGYQGLQNAFLDLDVDGEGYLNANVFTKKVLHRLNCPLTRPEREFLLEQLRAASIEKGENVFDYEQLGRICGLDSDDSASDCSTDHEPTKAISPTKSLQLGSGFLSAEKRLNEFLQGPLVDTDPSGRVVQTPRSLVTGAEKFLEIAESIDQDSTGLLHEDEFPRILAKCGVNISQDLLTGMLSRFPRSAGKSVRYSDFLQRFNQNPQCARARRELKELVIHLLPRLSAPTTDWLFFLRQRFEKYDMQMHSTMKGTLPTEAFLRAVQGRSSVLKLTTDEAAQVTSLFLRSSTNNSPSRLQYREFLVFVDECHRNLCIDISKSPATPNPPMFSPKSAQLSQPEVATPPSESTSVGDYLMYHATLQERRNFENLMEMLQNFQHENDLVATIQRIENGIMMPLGKNLQVKVQFAMTD